MRCLSVAPSPGQFQLLGATQTDLPPEIATVSLWAVPARSWMRLAYSLGRILWEILIWHVLRRWQSVKRDQALWCSADTSGQNQRTRTLTSSTRLSFLAALQDLLLQLSVPLLILLVPSVTQLLDALQKVTDVLRALRCRRHLGQQAVSTPNKISYQKEPDETQNTPGTVSFTIPQLSRKPSSRTE